MLSTTLWKQTAVLLAAGAFALASQAAITLSETPLFLTASVTPNIVLTLDDSGSMARGYVPDSIGDSTTKLNSPRFTAASYNAMYYNPQVTYAIPTRNDGVSYSTSFGTAYVNGFDTSKGSVNLADNGYRPIYNCEPGTSSSSCDRASGAGGGTTTTTANYSYTCRAMFDNRGNNNDRIYAWNCSPAMPFSGDGSAAEADNSTITVTGAGGYSRTYSVDSTRDEGGGEVRINLSTRNEITNDSNDLNNVRFSWSQTTTTTTTSGPAYYHLYYSNKPGAARPNGCNDNRETNACYIYVQVGSSDDIASGDAAAKRQNFANWYSFYRSRALAAMSAAMNAVTALGQNQVRLGWQTLNNGGCNSFGTSCQGYDGTNRENRIRTLDALKSGSTTVTHRSDFYNWVARMQVGSTTPLRAALKRAGDYFSTSGLNSPYAQEPYVTLGTELSCRRNFHVMLTDGLWNANNNVNYGGNVDTTATTLPDGTSYSPRAPYRSASNPPSGLSYSNNLADIAFKYWATDLRSSTTGSPALTNNLTPFTVDRSGTAADQYWNPRNNPATWQHMVNFNISFGLGSVLADPVWGGSTYAGDFAALAAGTKDWPATDETPTTNNEPDGHVYDLWHAAVNSRGQFFNADDPAGINSAFQTVFSSILSANPSSAALAANSTSIQTGTMVYQAKFDSTDWHGQLVAYNVNADGSVGSAQWDAATRLPAPAGRNITSWNGTQGSGFTSCTNDLSTSQQAVLNRNPSNVVDNLCSARLAWLRGDTSGEARNGGNFRNRPVSVLGDMINSDPVYVKNEDHGYANAGAAMTEKSSYAAFVAGKATRVPMVYIGANDGMLHGFRADSGASDSGRELMAHVPSASFDKLNRLMQIGYTHTYFVDGSPQAGDAYLGGAWKTVLVGGLGAGGKGIFALDVSDPTNHGPTKVLWEYSDAADLGYTFGQPQIARLASGHWVAIFGNGYNSTNDRAYLYVVNLADGSLLRKIPAGTATSNGLSAPALIDVDNDKIIDYAYAGDLQGNLWKFDLRGVASTSWGVGNGGSALFTARNTSNQVQPITVKPALSIPTGSPNGGVMVLFGTGQYLTSTDPANTQVQTFYSIWDNNTTGTVTRSSLQQQTINAQTNQFGYELRETSANTVNWLTQRGWYMDLTASGERVISQALVRYDRVIFLTTIPTADACVPGGESWLMEVEANSGSRTSVSVFDFNNDNTFNNSDKLTSGNTASGVKSTVGITKTPAWLEQSPTSEIAIKQMSGSSGGIFSLKNRKPAIAGQVRRLFWQQIQ